MKAECKFLKLCLLQRSAKVRSSALLAISGFLPPSQNVKNILSTLFSWNGGTSRICFVISKVLPGSKGKGFGLDLPCSSRYLFFNSMCNFPLSISMRCCWSNLYLSISLCFTFYRSSISNLNFSCSNFSLSNLSSLSNVPCLILSSRSSLSRHALTVFFISQFAF